MRLALLRRRFSATGGAESYLSRLMQALAARGHELHLFTESWEAPCPAQIHPVRCVASRARRPLEFAEKALEALSRHSFDCVFSLERTLKQDVYRAGDGLHRMWLRRRCQFAPWWRRWSTGLGGFHRAMCRLEAQTFSPRNTGRLIVNSEMVGREIRDNFDFPMDRVELIRNGVELHRFQSGDRQQIRHRFGVAEDQFLLLFVGTGWERKGLRFLLRALQRLPRHGTRLLIVGKGRKPFRPPENAIFAGELREVQHAYAAADLFVNLPIYDPSANVCFEALAAGLPVITTAFDGASEVIRPGENGSVISDPSDTTQVTRAIEFWRARPRPKVASLEDLGLERNVTRTVAVLERTAEEKRG